MEENYSKPDLSLGTMMIEEIVIVGGTSQGAA